MDHVRSKPAGKSISFNFKKIVKFEAKNKSKSLRKGVIPLHPSPVPPLAVCRFPPFVPSPRSKSDNRMRGQETGRPASLPGGECDRPRVEAPSPGGWGASICKEKDICICPLVLAVRFRTGWLRSRPGRAPVRRHWLAPGYASGLRILPKQAWKLAVRTENGS